MTHAELVQRAAAWLRRSRGCGVVLTEHTAGSECPDAIGWKRGFSILVECKVSRADFYADQRKPSRLRGPQDRPAWQCWYLTPPGLLRADDIPTWWGWLEAEPRRIVVRKAGDHEQAWDDRHVSALREEVQRLYQEVRRYQAQGLTYQKRADFLNADRFADPAALEDQPR